MLELLDDGNIVNDAEEMEILYLKAKSTANTDEKAETLKKAFELYQGYSSVKTVRGVLRPAFQMAVDDDYLQKNPFGFQLAGVVINDSVTREAITKDQMRKFLKFVHDDNNYCRYYEAFYILFHTGMRISEFCGLTIHDLDMEKRIIDINKQLQRTTKMEYMIESTKTNAGTRKLPMTEEVFRCFQAILEDREAPRVEKMVGGYTGFLYLDKNGMPEVAMHWEHRFNHAVSRYNEIYREQLPNITPHICRHTYCSNQAKAGMNPKTLQYLMGHSDIGVTMNVYTHLGMEDAAAEMARMEEVESARREQEKLSGLKEGKEKAEQEDVQSSVNGVESSAHRHNGGGRFFRWWKMGWKYGRVEVQIVKERIEDGANEKAALRFPITALSFASISIFPG